jgi:hypothetical protein
MKTIALFGLVLICGTLGAAHASQMGAMAQLLFAHQPAEGFALAKAPPAPDYAQARSWAALPEAPGMSAAAPKGTTTIDPRTAQVDVFFIHPTTFFSNSQWSQPLDNADTNKRTDEGTIRNQASVFNGCCRIYAPRYRQMTFSGFLKASPDANAALDLAYSDVKRAFEYYLAHYNHGRPFIIASHSQGSRHARLLVEQMIDGSKLQDRMVAAYIIGTWLDQDWFAHLKSVKPCQGATDTGCVITWSTLADDADGQAMRAAFAKRSGVTDDAVATSFAQHKFVCINPLSWSAGDATAPASLDLGGWVYGRGVTPRPPDPGLVSARCDDGGLYVSRPDDIAYRIALLPGGNYHNYDYQLAYMNIRANAIARVNAFLAHKPTHS